MKAYRRLIALLKACKSKLGLSEAVPSQEKEDAHSDHTKSLDPVSWPSFPPSAPEVIIAAPASYRASQITPRRFAAPKGKTRDTSLFALYRLYEWFLVDHVTGYRNDLEIFWRHSDWSIKDIPDPADTCPARYAVLAGVANFLMLSFNKKVSYGASRKAPAIMTEEYIDALQAVPESEREWEHLPEWAANVPSLPITLIVPTHDGETLTGLDDPRADNFMRSKNILMWTPHIHFT